MKARFIFPLLLSSVVIAQPGGTFTATGSMTEARSFHTATLLNDGRVLIAGGSSDSSAELYVPATGTFTPTGNMTTPRSGHSATLLPDGRVLIAGGRAGHPGTAEIYDPTSGTFTATGNMLRTYNISNNATLLTNGRVLITWEDGLDPELYDPATGSFSSAGAYAGGANPCDFCSPPALLADGRLLVSAVQPAQLYDPDSATFGATGRMIEPDHTTATLLMNGKVLLTGGESVGRSASAELYDPATGAFTSTNAMTQPRVWHSATLLPDGTVLVAGGETDSCGGNTCTFAGTVATAELYDSATGTFTSTGRMTVARELQTATLLRDGTVLITGGVGYGGIGAFSGGTNTAEIYTPVVLIPAPVPPIITGAANAASNVSGAIAPGELIILTGHGLGSVQLVSAAPADGLYPSQLAGTTVLVNGLSARLIYTSATQVAAVVPDVIPEGTAQIAVAYQGQTSLPLSVPVAPLAPGIFTVDSTGRGHAATVNQAGSINAPVNWGDTITLFVTGAGRATSGSVVFYPDSTLQIAIPLTGGGLQRTAAGVTQINVPIPYGLDCDVPVTVQLGNVSSQPGVTIAMRICI